MCAAEWFSGWRHADDGYRGDVWIWVRMTPLLYFLAALALVSLGSVGCTVTHDGLDLCKYEGFASEPDCTHTEPATTTETVTAGCASTGGTCVEEAPDGFSGPNLYWIGPASEKPTCESIGLLPGANAYANLGPVGHTCPTCGCGPSETTCSPSVNWTVSAAKCSGDSALLSSFDVVLDSWNCACNTDNAIAEDAQCEGVPCAQSVTVQAPNAIGAPCAVQTTGKEEKQAPPWPWGTVAQECLVTPTESCPGGEGDVCIPTPGDFVACVSVEHGEHDGDIDCPPFYRDEVYQMYRGAEDTRACAPCACGLPSGGECAVTATAYNDGDCSDFMGAVVVFSGDGEACFDVSPGVALGSKSAEVKLAVAGSCVPAGGEVVGAVTPIRRVTLCCHREVAP